MWLDLHLQFLGLVCFDPLHGPCLTSHFSNSYQFFGPSPFPKGSGWCFQPSGQRSGLPGLKTWRRSCGNPEQSVIERWTQPHTTYVLDPLQLLKDIHFPRIEISNTRGHHFKVRRAKFKGECRASFYTNGVCRGWWWSQIGYLHLKDFGIGTWIWREWIWIMCRQILLGLASHSAQTLWA